MQRATTLMMAVLAVAFVCAASATAGVIQNGGGNISTGQIFSAGANAWNMPPTTITSATLNAPTEPFPASNWKYAGSLEWTGNPLVLDDVANPGGGIAHGYFGAGGTLEIIGQVTDFFNTPIFAGTLLTATVGAFEVQESGPSTDNIDIISPPIFTVTGGWLSSGVGLNSMPVGYEYVLSTTGIQVQNGGPTVDDFSMDIFTTAGTLMQIAFHDVPEPGSLVLLLAGGSLLLRRRQS